VPQTRHFLASAFHRARSASSEASHRIRRSRPGPSYWASSCPLASRTHCFLLRPSYSSSPLASRIQGLQICSCFFLLHGAASFLELASPLPFRIQALRPFLPSCLASSAFHPWASLHWSDRHPSCLAFLLKGPSCSASSEGGIPRVSCNTCQECSNSKLGSMHTAIVPKKHKDLLAHPILPPRILGDALICLAYISDQDGCQGLDRSEVNGLHNAEACYGYLFLDPFLRFGRMKLPLIKQLLKLS